MKKVNMSAALFGVLVALAFSSASLAQQNGTTLSTTKTATGFWERTIEYDWTVQKSVSPSQIEVAKGASQTVTYTISTTKTAKAPVDTFGATGQICVNNGGAVATQNLVVVDNVQAKVAKGMFQTIASFPVDISAKPILGPGESYCYNYRVTFAPIPGATYRNEANVTITNHAGWLPGGTNCPGPAVCAFGPQYRVGFTLPATYTTVYKDQNASISDLFTNLPGFTVNVSDAGPWSQSAAGNITFTATITNNDANCASSYQLHNAAKLVESDTGDERNADANLGISTPSCNEVLFSGCTYTRGYWAQHPDAWPVDSLTLGNVSYTKAELLSILGQPTAGNGLIQLASQLIAAKLNTLKSVDPASGGQLFNSLAAADALIGGLVVPPVGSGFIAPADATALIGQLTLFNQGGPVSPGNGDYDGDTVIDGPGHCL